MEVYATHGRLTVYIIGGYSIALWASAFVSAACAGAAWRRRATSGGASFAFMMAAVVVWSAFAGLGSAAVGVSRKVLYTQVGYLGVCSVAPFFFAFALRYAGKGALLTPLRLVLLWLVPAATTVMAATNSLHGLLWSSFTLDEAGGRNALLFGYGPWHWIAVAYFALLVLSATIILVRAALRQGRLYRLQSVVFALGAAIPWIGEALYLAPFTPWPGLDLPPIGFAVTGALLLMAMSRLSLFDIVPVARSALVERARDGIIVLDAEDRIVDINAAARRLFGIEEEVIGKPAALVLGDAHGPLMRARPSPQSGAAGDVTVELPLAGDPPRHFEATVSLLRGPRGTAAGCLVFLHDVSTRRQAEQEKETLIRELTAALKDVKTLQGLLPICASCRKVRNDRGYWENIESYISEHSRTQFTHGLCEECAARLYPELQEREPRST
jgi:PAS domain S-box-containing protein